jgi:hypothetical protein
MAMASSPLGSSAWPAVIWYVPDVAVSKAYTALPSWPAVS